MFHTRYTLHKRAYQHRVANAMEIMLCEVLCLANDYVSIPSYASHSNEPETAENAVMRKMSECPQDMRAYWRMSEYIFKVIEYSTSRELQPARDMIHRIRRRDLFGFAGETILTSEMMRKILHTTGQANEKLEDIVKRQLWQMIGDDVLQHTAAIEENDLFCYVIKMGYGKGNKNPLTSSTAFYQPDKSQARNQGNADTVWILGSLPEG